MSSLSLFLSFTATGQKGVKVPVTQSSKTWNSGSRVNTQVCPVHACGCLRFCAIGRLREKRRCEKPNNHGCFCGLKHPTSLNCLGEHGTVFKWTPRCLKLDGRGTERLAGMADYSSSRGKSKTETSRMDFSYFSILSNYLIK